MKVEFTEPKAPGEPWIAMIAMPHPFGDIVDEAGSGRSVLIEYGNTEDEAAQNVLRKFGARLREHIKQHGWPITQVNPEAHSEMWDAIVEFTFNRGGDPYRQSERRDAAAHEINRLLAEWFKIR